MDRIIDLEWDEVVPGQWVRWITPQFVRRGKITQKKGKSLRVRFDGEYLDTTIPDAEWYFALMRKDHGLVVIEHPDDDPKTPEDFGDMITPDEAAALLGTDAKGIRRRLRSGSIRGIKQNGTWQVSKQSLNLGD